MLQVLVLLQFTDKDECSDSTANCHTYATCTNTDGSFTCACNYGYNGDGTDCTGNITKGRISFIMK